MRWDADNSVELHVTGVPDEVESVTRRLAAGLALSRVTPEKAAEPAPAASGHWARLRWTWAFAIGLTTIAGGIAAVLALVIH